MIDWFAQTLRTYPEIAIFLSLALGYYFGSFTYKGLGLGAVTATLIAAVIIGQLGITISGPLKPTFFLMFLFAIGYGVGPQFVRGIAKDGVPQAMFAVVVCVFCLIAAVSGRQDGRLRSRLGRGTLRRFADDLGIDGPCHRCDQPSRSAAGPDQDSSSMQCRLPTPSLTSSAPSDPRLLLPCWDLLSSASTSRPPASAMRKSTAARRSWAVRARPGTSSSCAHSASRKAARVVGKTAQEAEALLPEQRVFIQRIRRGSQIIDATADTVIQAGDVVAIAGRRDVLVNLIGTAADEVDDRELLAVPAEGVDVYVTAKDVDGKTLAELAQSPWARGVFLRKITRGATATDIPILPDTQLYRGDIVNLVGRTQDIGAATKSLGYPDRATDVADVAFIGAAIAIGAFVGALVWKIGSVPLTLSTSGGALISGLFFGWLRSVRPTFGRIPSSTVWFMNSVGLNVFIAVVGISSGPGFVAGLQKLGFGLFLWGVVVTTVPLILAMYVGKYLFRFDDAILLGCVSGARTTTASLGMVNDRAKSQIPGLGYTVTYAVGNTLLTIWGMVIVILLS